MISEWDQHRFARIEGHRLTRARLKEQFKDGMIVPDELEEAIARQLAPASPGIPWRSSEMEQIGCREGKHLPALEFFWEHPASAAKRKPQSLHTMRLPSPPQAAFKRSID